MCCLLAIEAEFICNLGESPGLPLRKGVKRREEGGIYDMGEWEGVLNKVSMREGNSEW